MPLNFLRNFLFVHVPKTGGTSVRNWLFKQTQEWPVSAQGHLRLKSYQYYLSEVWFQKTFKFAFVRNPWDRHVSAYFYHKTDHLKQAAPEEYEKYAKLSFDEYLFTCPLRAQRFWLVDRDGQLGLNFIGRFENLAADLNEIGKHLGFGEIEVPHFLRSKHNHYTTYYNNRTRKRVEELDREDIQEFGYTFSPVKLY